VGRVIEWEVESTCNQKAVFLLKSKTHFTENQEGVVCKILLLNSFLNLSHFDGFVASVTV